MDILFDYLMVFLIGGIICLFGQLLIITTKMTSARILVFFVVVGVVLDALTLFKPIASFAKAGVNVPIIGFGAALSRGAINAVQSSGFIGIFTGGLAATAGGIAAAVFFALLFGLIFHSKTK